MKRLIIGVLLITISLSGCKRVKDGEALYEVTFKGKWSSDSHPVNFPSNDHFSSAVGLSHSDLGIIFQEGELASQGIEEMAESGSNGVLKSEVENIISNGNALEYIKGKGLSEGNASESFEFKVSEEFPFVSLVSMIAPSPDWFVAAKEILLFRNGEFVEEITVDGILYDSGTDSGTNYTSANEDTNPPEPISIMIYPPLGDSVQIIAPVAQFEFKRIK